MRPQVDLCGRSINVGRPKGYVEPASGHAPAAPVWQPGMAVPGAPAAAPAMPGPPAMAMPSFPGMPGAPAAAAGPVPTCVVLLESLVTVKDLRDPEERQDLCEDVKEECHKVTPPPPPPFWLCPAHCTVPMTASSFVLVVAMLSTVFLVCLFVHVKKLWFAGGLLWFMFSGFGGYFEKTITPGRKHMRDIPSETAVYCRTIRT